jgi:hypothetical protein
VATSPPYNVTIAGTLFNVFAHLHDGGINVSLKRNGQPICDSRVIYGGAQGTTTIGGEIWETIQSYSECKKPIDVKVGDQLVVEATYDTKAHRLRPGAADHSMGAEAMGLLGYAFAPAV